MQSGLWPRKWVAAYRQSPPVGPHCPSPFPWQGCAHFTPGVSADCLVAVGLILIPRSVAGVTSSPPRPAGLDARAPRAGPRAEDVQGRWEAGSPVAESWRKGKSQCAWPLPSCDCPGLPSEVWASCDPKSYCHGRPSLCLLAPSHRHGLSGQDTSLWWQGSHFLRGLLRQPGQDAYTLDSARSPGPPTISTTGLGGGGGPEMRCGFSQV